MRDVTAGERVATEIGATDVRYLELAKLDSVEAFARGWDGPLHILVNNAGVMAIPELTLNEAGLEMQFATNHVGHFALAHGLHGALAAEGARIVSVSSTGHLRSPVVFDDLNFAFRDYEGVPRLRAVQDGERAVRGRRDRALGARRHHANALMPGGIATALQRHQPPEYIEQAQEGHAPQDARAGRGDVGPAGGPSRARGRRRPLLRGLRRGARRSSAAASAAPAASRPTRSTPTTATGCGSCPSGSSARTSGSAVTR